MLADVTCWVWVVKVEFFSVVVGVIVVMVIMAVTVTVTMTVTVSMSMSMTVIVSVTPTLTIFLVRTTMRVVVMHMIHVFTLRSRNRIALLIGLQIPTFQKVTNDQDSSRSQAILQRPRSVNHILEVMESKPHGREIEILELGCGKFFGRRIALVE